MILIIIMIKKMIITGEEQDDNETIRRTEGESKNRKRESSIDREMRKRLSLLFPRTLLCKGRIFLACVNVKCCLA